VRLFLIACFPIIVACGSSSSSSGGGTNVVSCADLSDAGGNLPACITYRDVADSQVDNIKSSCNQVFGSSTAGVNVASCPTANLSGCCNATGNGMRIQTCAYGLTQAQIEQQSAACAKNQTNGLWSPTM
jgi:hypothetical protein